MNNKSSMNVLDLKNAIRILLILLVAISSQADAGRVNFLGYVYARDLIKLNGEYQWVQHESDGRVIQSSVRPVSQYPLDEWRVVSENEFTGKVAQYNEEISALTLALTGIGNLDINEVFLTKEAYEGRSEFSTLPGITYEGPALAPETTHVLIMPQALRYLADPKKLIIKEFDLNPGSNVIISENGSALLNTHTGEISSETVTPYRWGMLTGMIKLRDGGENFEDYRRPEDDQGYFKRYGHEQPVKPLAGVVIDNQIANTATTDSEGRYKLEFFQPACGGGFNYYSYSSLQTAKLFSKRFNPKNSSPKLYYVKRNGFINCYTSHTGVVPIVGYVGFVAHQSTSPVPLDFIVDITVLSGVAKLVDPISEQQIPIAAETSYAVTTVGEHPEAESTMFDFDSDGIQNIDFDYDGEPDTVVKGSMQTVPGTTTDELYFVPDSVPALITNQSATKIWGVFLKASSGTPGQDQPDFTRVMDIEPNFEHEGLLKTISAQDLTNTDLYVIRVSDGTLLGERLGLTDEDVDAYSDFGAIDCSNGGCQGGEEIQKGAFFYRMEIRGTAGYFFRGDTMQKGSLYWQSEYGVDVTKFGQRYSDHLKPGELLKIYAINRSTGYMGSVTTTVKSAGQDFSAGAAGQGASDEELYFQIDTIKMYPPNLKVWAERNTKIEAGITKDEINEYTIGSEGAATVKDQHIRVFTEWYDRDGSPLPEEFAERGVGFTGRLVHLTADKTLPDTQNNQGVEHFSIVPGLRTQVLQLPQSVISNQHFYIQVSGEPKDRAVVFGQNTRIGEPDFDVGTHTGKLANRPAKFVPILVPVFDEASTQLQEQEYRSALASGRTPPKPKALFNDQYRPEYQFTLYDLEMNQINRETDGVTTDLLPSQQPVIASSDDFIRLLYSLTVPEFSPLDYLNINSEKELIFALGEHEISATVGANQQITFDNLEHLASLDPEDFLSLRLYANNDSANILWEFAFEVFTLDTQLDNYDAKSGDVLFVSADAPTVPLQAIIIGYANREPEFKVPKRVEWSVQGLGHVDEVVQVNADTGAFFNTLNLPTVAGSKTTVKARLGNETPPLEEKIQDITVVPGIPARIDVSVSGTAYVREFGELSVEVKAYDAHNNNVSDGTSIDIDISGDAVMPEYEGGTVSGVVNALVRGNQYAGDITLHVQVGDVSQDIPLTIHPFNIALSSLPARIEPNTNDTFQVRVTTADNDPVPNVPVNLGTTFGFFEDETVTTNSNGEAEVRFRSPSSRGEAIITARVGYNDGAVATLPVEYAAYLGNPPLEVERKLLVGDASQAGTVDYERYDGTTIPLPYETSLNVTVKGTPNTSVPVTIGTLADPNLNPLAAYFMNHLDAEEVNEVVRYHAPDELGLSTGRAYDILVDKQSPHGNVGKSYYFDNRVVSSLNARIEIADASAVAKPDAISFRVDVKPAAFDGDIFNVGQAQSLSLNSSGELTYRIETSAGVFNITSAALTPNQWHTVAGRYFNGQLELEVDGVAVTPVAATGALSYSHNQLTLGQDYTGHLSELLWYDWNGQPLLRLPNNDVTMQVPLDATGKAVVKLSSTGQLNQHLSNAALGQHRITLATTGFQQPVNLLSQATYALIAGEYATTLEWQQLETQYPIQLTQSYLPNIKNPLDLFISPAYAGWLDGLPSWAGAALDWVLPIRDIEMVFTQMGYLLNKDARFDPVETAIAGLGILTVVPVAKPLKFVLNPIKKLYRSVGNKPFMKAMASVMGRYAEHAKKLDFDKMYSLLPYLLIVAEMIQEPDAILLMVDSIESADDLFVWIDFLNLPVEGWDGDGEPPEVELVAHNTSAWSQAPEMIAGLLVNKAYAASPRKKRIDGGKISEALKKLRTNYGPELQSKPQRVTKTLEAIVGGVKKTKQNIDIRKLVSDWKFLSTSLGLGIRAGYKKLKSFLIGYSDSRIPPSLFLTVVGYLESECHAGQLNADVCQALYKKYALILKDVLTGSTAELDEETPAGAAGETDNPFATFIGSGAHGEMFHVMMVAYYQLLGQTPIKGIERPRSVWLFADEGARASLTAAETIAKYQRRVDIVLGTSEPGASEQWVELKSLRAKGPSNLTETKSDGFSKWTLAAKGKGSAKKSTYHKQYVLDRIATHNRARPWKNENQARTPIDVSEFIWWFHKFSVDVKARRNGPVIRTDVSPQLGSYTVGTTTSIRGKQTALPKGNNEQRMLNLGFDELADNKEYRRELGNGISDNGAIKEASLKNLILDQLRNRIEGYVVGGEDEFNDLLSKIL